MAITLERGVVCSSRYAESVTWHIDEILFNAAVDRRDLDGTNHAIDGQLSNLATFVQCAQMVNFFVQFDSAKLMIFFLCYHGAECGSLQPSPAATPL